MFKIDKQLEFVTYQVDLSVNVVTPSTAYYRTYLHYLLLFTNL